jgi:hypothetical protein
MYLLRIMPPCSGIATTRHVTGGRSSPPPSGRHEGHMRIGLVSRYCPVGRNVTKKSPWAMSNSDTDPMTTGQRDETHNNTVICTLHVNSATRRLEVMWL